MTLKLQKQLITVLICILFTASSLVQAETSTNDKPYKWCHTVRSGEIEQYQELIIKTYTSWIISFSAGHLQTFSYDDVKNRRVKCFNSKYETLDLEAIIKDKRDGDTRTCGKRDNATHGNRSVSVNNNSGSCNI